MDNVWKKNTDGVNAIGSSSKDSRLKKTLLLLINEETNTHTAFTQKTKLPKKQEQISAESSTIHCTTRNRKNQQKKAFK